MSVTTKTYFKYFLPCFVVFLLAYLFPLSVHGQAYTLKITGKLREALGETACYERISTVNPPVLTVTGATFATTPTCTVNESLPKVYDTFRCIVEFPSSMEGQSRQITILSSTVGDPRTYQYQKMIVADTGSCTLTDNNSLTVTVPGVDGADIEKDMLFVHRLPWVKLKDASFAALRSYSGIIPLNVEPYDGEDTDSRDGGRLFSSGSSSGVSLGIQDQPAIPAWNLGTGKVSMNNWTNESYAFNRYHTRTLFFDYVRAHKSYKTINSIAEITGDGVYRIGTDQNAVAAVIDSNATVSQFDDKKVLLFVTGKLSMNVREFAPSNATTVLVSPEIEFGPQTEYMESIFVSRVVTITEKNPLGEYGLKIKGNIVASEYMVNNRKIIDNAFPSLFVIFDPNMYIRMLPFLSTTDYVWIDE